MRNPKRALMHSQKLSFAALSQIVKCYAYWLTATQAVSGQFRLRSPASRNTTYKIYGLLRQRLTEAGYYQRYDEDDPKHKENAIFQSAHDHLQHLLRQRHGVTADNRAYHLSEIQFRQLNPRLNHDRHFREIIKLLKLTGPLNKPLDRSIDLAANLEVIECDREVVRIRLGIRFYRRRLAFLKKHHPHDEEAIRVTALYPEVFEHLIEDVRERQKKLILTIERQKRLSAATSKSATKRASRQPKPDRKNVRFR